MPAAERRELLALAGFMAVNPSSTTAPNARGNRRQHETETERLRVLDVFRSRPVMAVATVSTLAALLEITPKLERFRLLHPVRAEEPEKTASPLATTTLSVGEATLSEESHEAAQASLERSLTRPAASPIAKSDETEGNFADLAAKPPPIPIEDPSGRALEPFFQRLRVTQSGSSNAKTRILHYGDSVVASDYVSSTLRRRFQERYGDGGHGFTLIANAWPAYFHEGVSRYATGGWLISRVVGPLASDGWHGLGGVSFRAPPNLLTRIGTAKKGEVGRRVSQFELAYVESPEGGTAEVRIDGKPVTVLDTRSEVKRFRTASFDIPDGEHEFELQTLKGTSRYFGLVMERHAPGVVLDALGIQGARIRFLDKQDDEHFKEQLKWRDPALVVYQFGANESADGYAYSMADYYTTMRAVIEQQRRALPNASCLIVGAMDRASRTGDEIKSLSIIPLIVREQRRVAQDLGCAFFDTFTAMGGNGSMPRWFRRGLGQADLTHPTAVGAEVLGNWLYRAVMAVAREQASAAPKTAP
ncbi:MAG: GDSL-type esterase/lipase family protein [Polyangiaceae bacterium]